MNKILIIRIRIAHHTAVVKDFAEQTFTIAVDIATFEMSAAQLNGAIAEISGPLRPNCSVVIAMSSWKI